MIFLELFKLHALVIHDLSCQIYEVAKIHTLKLSCLTDYH